MKLLKQKGTGRAKQDGKKRPPLAKVRGKKINMKTTYMNKGNNS